jgi:hypothetical protein
MNYKREERTRQISIRKPENILKNVISAPLERVDMTDPWMNRKKFPIS